MVKIDIDFQKYYRSFFEGKQITKQGFASFGMFKNEYERGKVFDNLVLDVQS